MKKMILMLAIALSAFAANAQNTFGIKGGLNIANLTYESSGMTYSTDNKTSFHIGLIMDHPFSSTLSLQPGAFLSSKGGKINWKSGGLNLSSEISYLYLEIPVNLMVKVPLGSANLLVYGGPYLGLGLSGTDGGEAVVWGSGDNDVNRFDFGLNLGAGIQINQFLISVQYGIGMANLANSAGDKINNKVVGITLGYMFGK